MAARLERDRGNEVEEGSGEAREGRADQESGFEEADALGPEDGGEEKRTEADDAPIIFEAAAPEREGKEREEAVVLEDSRPEEAEDAQREQGEVPHVARHRGGAFPERELEGEEQRRSHRRNPGQWNRQEAEGVSFPLPLFPRSVVGQEGHRFREEPEGDAREKGGREIQRDRLARSGKPADGPGEQQRHGPELHRVPVPARDL